MSSSLMMLWSYLTLCVILGFFRVPRIRNLKDYALGSTQFSTLILAFSMIATAIGPAETMGQVEKAFSIGIVFCVTAVLQLVRWFFMGWVLAPALYYLRANNCNTLADIMIFLFGKWGRYICVASLVIGIAVLAMFYKAAAFVLQKYLNIPFFYGATIIAVSIAIYAIFGGMHAIIMTDVAQFVIFVIVIPAIFFIGISNIDIQQTIAMIPNEKITISREQIPLFISFIIYGIIPITGLPYIQRGLMAANAHQLRRMFYTTGIFTFIFFSMMGVIGLIVAGISPDVQSDNALFAFIDNAVPASISGMFAVSILAIIMSTASSFLNSVTVVIIKDVIAPVFPSLRSDDKQIFLTKFAGIVVAVASFGIMFVKEHIMDMLWTLDNFWDPFVSIPLILGLLGVRVQAKDFKYVVFTALAAVLIARAIHGEFDTITLCAGVFASMIMMFVLRDKSIQKSDRAIDENENDSAMIKAPSSSL